MIDDIKNYLGRYKNINSKLDCKLETLAATVRRQELIRKSYACNDYILKDCDAQLQRLADRIGAEIDELTATRDEIKSAL